MTPDFPAPRLLFGAILVVLSFSAWLQAMEPVPAREWTSTAGTKLEAKANAMKDGFVQFEAVDGRLIPVQVASLIIEDQLLLHQHFRSKPPEGLPYPIGEASGPHAATADSNFFIYIPNSLQVGRKAPLLVFTGAGGGNRGSVQNFVKGAEINGWIVAASVESRNGRGWDDNHNSAKECVEYLIETLPVDPNRIYFSGNSGGGAMAFMNAARMNAAGAMPMIGYNSGLLYSEVGHYYVLGGARDYNRYTSALGAAGAKDRGVHRTHPGGHGRTPTWILDEGMAWLNGRFLEAKENDSAFAAERVDWEMNMIEWILELTESHPYRAYYWCRFLQETYKTTSFNAARLSAIATELEGDEINARYAEGIDAIKEFSRKHLADQGGGARFAHTTPAIERAAAGLVERYAGVPHIEEVFKELGQQTVGR